MGSGRSVKKTVTMTRAGLGVDTTTFQRNRGKRVGRLYDPESDEELEIAKAYASDGLCWWCWGNKTYKALSQHWVKTHDFDMQWIRDLFKVGKSHSFISEDLKDTFSVRGRKYYNPNKLISKKGTKKNLSKFGIASQKKKAQKVKHSKPCVICYKGIYTHRSGHRPKTCGAACEFALRSRNSTLIRARPEDKAAASERAKRHYREGRLTGLNRAGKLAR